MAFSQAQYEAVIQRIKTGTAKIGAKNQQVMPAARHAASHWYLPDGVKSTIIWMAEKLTRMSEWIIRKSEELLESVFAPILFFEAGWKWQDVRIKASTVEGSVSPGALGSSKWNGAAKDDYRAAITSQSSAAGRVKTVSSSISTSLYVCALAGLTFYGALGIIIYNFLGALAGAIVALVSGVFSLPGFLAGVADCGVTAAMIFGAVAAASLCLGAQAQQMGSIHGEAMDNASFPGGHWPKATGNS
ncbi:hypothetical protein GCM10029978_089120 [Actinoallomurus acanthiterrae]